MCEKITSEPYPLTTGVPQGSVLGPILFTLYVAPVVSIVNKHGLYYHYYADDLLIYGPLNKSNGDETLFNIFSCLEEVRWWFLTNKLVINPAKTESILVGTPQLISRHRGTVALNFAGNVVTPAEHLKYLGVVLDSTLSLSKHCSSIAASVNRVARSIRHIRSGLTTELAAALAVSLGTAKLDYCNSIFANTSLSNQTKLQRSQNRLARVVLRKPWFYSDSEL
jgi:hypothetical protein